MTVSLPAPEGPDTTKSTPAGARLGPGGVWALHPSRTFLDSWLIERLAHDLNDVLARSRIDDVAPVPGGLLLSCYRRGQAWNLHVALDPPVPAVWACAGGLRPAGRDDAWIGAGPALLRGAHIESVSALCGDRVIFIDASSRSPFGVPSPTRIVVELQPGKSNILVLRPSKRRSHPWVIVAVRKQFPAGRRRIATGAPYTPPPPRRAALDRAQFIVAARDLDLDDAAGWERLARAYDPLCSPPLAREVWWQCRRHAGRGGAAAHAWLGIWERMRRALTELAAQDGPVYVWRLGDELEAVHLLPLQWPLGERAQLRSVNDLCAAALFAPPAQASEPRSDARTPEWETGIHARITRCRRDMQALEESLAQSVDPQLLLQAGHAIYANLGRLARGSTELTTDDGRRIVLDPALTPQENAAAYFVRYRKACSGRRTIQARLRDLQRDLEYWEHVRWDLQRDDLSSDERAAVQADVASALTGHPPAHRRRRPPERKSVDLGDGVVAYVGRSAQDNDRLTFGFAAPSDFWFHARGVPGSHVIVKSPRGALTERQVQRAAALAAAHSRAARDAAVDVDYTRRRYVRRRGKPGMVSYTHAQTIRVRPSL